MVHSVEVSFVILAYLCLRQESKPCAHTCRALKGTDNAQETKYRIQHMHGSRLQTRQIHVRGHQ